MSLIRQRTKNLMFAGFIGFICGSILITVLVMFVIKGNDSFVTWMTEEFKLQKEQTQSEEEIIKIGVYLLTETVQKGDVIKQEMLKRVDLIDSIVPANAVLDISMIIDQKATMALEANTLITSTVIIKPELSEITADLVEIRDIHIPGIMEVGDTINLRIHFPTGQDYLVLEKKTVDFLTTEEDCFYVTLDEEEILSYASAREDLLLYPGTMFYISKEHTLYKEMDAQDLAIETTDYISYPLNPNALQLSIRYADPEILKQRQFLDERLTNYYALEGSKFKYVVDESLAVQPTDQIVQIGSESNTDASDVEPISASESITGTETTSGTTLGTQSGATSGTDQNAAQGTSTGTSTDTTTEQPTTTTFGF